jgi:hypothetical protein
MAIQQRFVPLLESRSARAQNTIVILSAPVLALFFLLGFLGLVTGLYSAWVAWRGAMLVGSIALGSSVYLRWKVTRMAEAGRATTAKVRRRAATFDWNRLFGGLAANDNVRSIVKLLPAETVSYTFEDQGRTRKGMFFLLGGESPESEDPGEVTLLVDPERHFVRSVLIRPPE